jgi:hypothetical protein
MIAQIRAVVPGSDSPDLSAIDLRDHCVAFTGVCSSVAATTSSTLSNRIDGGRPGRSSSTKPAKRLSTNRRRHLFTVFGATLRSAATRLFATPRSAHASTIRDRDANARDDFAPPRPANQLPTLHIGQHQLGPRTPSTRHKNITFKIGAVKITV